MLNSGSAEKDGEFIFTVQQIGEYGFCFSNAMSTFAQKVVTFDIDVSGESKTVTKTSSDEIARKEVEPIQVSTDSIKEGLIKIDRTLSFYRTRERVRIAGGKYWLFGLLANLFLFCSATLTLSTRPSPVCSGRR